jgi:ligand-binding sensor domain-containing protein
MHHQHADAVILVLVIGGTVAFVVVVMLIALRMRRRLYAGAALDQWDEIRRGLSNRKQRHVQWATMRRRPVSAAALAPAQLAYISYARYTVERTPWKTSRWFRTAMLSLYSLLAVGMVIQGIQDSQERIFHFALAAVWAALAVLWVPVMSRALTRQPARLEHLRTQINERYGPALPI